MSYRWLLPTLFIALPAWAQSPPPMETADTAESALYADAPTDERTLTMQQLSRDGLELSGADPVRQFEFGVRGDRLVTQALLDLHYTPSPALQADVSHIKVYLNDELMDSVPLDPSASRETQRQQIELDPLLIGDFNRLRLELVGHYTNMCQDPAHTSIWANIGHQSTLTLHQQALPLANDLSLLPQPFFDAHDQTALELPLVLPPDPDLDIQRAGGIVASWFGAQSGWRGQHFPVTFSMPPRRHAVVLATNNERPNFLADYPPVDAPTIEIISHPETPYAKLLLILGPDTESLVDAARGLALGNTLLRGQSARIDALERLEPRQPYDAPAWVPTDRPVSFAELMEYPEQLQARGVRPTPIEVTLRTPPDLFVWREKDIELQLGYRYSPPAPDTGSRLDVSLNDQFLHALALAPDGGEEPIQVPVLQDLMSDQHRVAIPPFMLKALNQLRFDFVYARRTGGASSDGCQRTAAAPQQVGIDESSTIDFQGYPHYLAMPALDTFATAGFPFSRLADLSQTLVVMPDAPSAIELTTLFDTLGRIGAQTGYPGVAMQLINDWNAAETIDADILAFDSLPESLEHSEPALALGPEAYSRLQLASDAGSGDEVTVTAHGPLAAILETQSPFFEQRSIVALLAPRPADQRLLNGTLKDPTGIAGIHGSVAIVRDSGITSHTTGERYFVGELPWLTWLWYHLSSRPWLITGITVLTVLLIAVLLRLTLNRLGSRRLADDEE